LAAEGYHAPRSIPPCFPPLLFLLPGSFRPGTHPDLQGYWTNTTLTPLERPTDLAGKAVFTEKESADYGTPRPRHRRLR